MNDDDPNGWQDEPARPPADKPRKRLNSARSRPLSFVFVVWGFGLVLLAAGLYSRFIRLGFTPLLAFLLVGICALTGLLIYALLNRRNGP